MHAVPFARALGHQRRHRFLRRPLHRRVQRGIHREPVREHALNAEDVLELRDDVGREIRILVRLDAAVLGADEPQRLRVRRVGGRLRHIMVRDHAIEHVALALERERTIRVRVVGGRRGDEPGEHRSLAQRETAHVLTEIRVACGLHAVRAGTEVDEVEIALEDLVLRVVALDLQREQRLLDLAAHGLFVRQEQVARELLRDGARALLDLLVLVVRQRRAGDAAEIHAAVAVEALVLARDDGLAHHGWYLRDRHVHAVLVVQAREERAVAREDARGARWLDRRQPADVGQVLTVRREHGDAHDPDDEHDRDQHDQNGETGSAQTAARQRLHVDGRAGRPGRSTTTE